MRLVLYFEVLDLYFGVLKGPAVTSLFVRESCLDCVFLDPPDVTREGRDLRGRFVEGFDHIWF